MGITHLCDGRNMHCCFCQEKLLCGAFEAEGILFGWMSSLKEHGCYDGVHWYLSSYQHELFCFWLVLLPVTYLPSTAAPFKHNAQCRYYHILHWMSRLHCSPTGIFSQCPQSVMQRKHPLLPHTLRGIGS